MTCFIAKNLLSEFLDDALDPARAREIEDHVAGCAACSKELAELRRVQQMLRGLPIQRVPADFLAKVTAKAQQKSFLDRASGALSVLWTLPPPAKAGVAFAASLVLVITVWFNNQEHRGAWDLVAARGPAVAKLDDSPARISAPPAEADADLASAAPAKELAAANAATPSPDRLRDAAKDEKAVGFATGHAGGAASESPRSSAGAGLQREAPPPPPSVESREAKKKESESQTRAVAAAPVASPGLYASVPATAVRTPASAAKPQPIRVAKAAEKRDTEESLPVISGASDAVGMTEPSYAPADDWGGAGGDGAERGKADKSPASARKGRAQGEVATADAAVAESSVSAEGAGSGAAPGAAPVAQTKTAAAGPLAVRYLTESGTGPAEIVDAARAAGGTVVSGAPPSLAKSGASTVVILDMPAGSWTAFAEKLAGRGDLEIQGDAPARRTRVRIEVVKR